MVRYLIFCLSFYIPLFSSPLEQNDIKNRDFDREANQSLIKNNSLTRFNIKTRLRTAQNGDYLVFESNKIITVLSIRALSSDSVTFEEISIPSQTLKKHPSSWAEWVKNKAPGHTSWAMTEIDLHSGQIIECYSFSRSSWIQLSSKESLFSTLLQLPLQLMDPQKQPRIGPPPPQGELDVRKIWAPPLYFEGKKKNNPHFDAYETNWPQDGTELSGKTVSLYFDQETKFPFPFWIQVEASYATVSIRAIDSGKNLPSPFAFLPKKAPQFLGHPKKTKDGLRFSIKSPKYYRDFELFAIDVTGKEKQICPISHFLIEEESEILTVEINNELLDRALEPDHRYTWLLVPKGHTQSYTETIKPFIWSSQD